MNYLFVFVASLVLSLILVPIIRRLMLKLDVLNMPGEDRWRKDPVALMGGIGIFASFVIASMPKFQLSREIIVAMLGGLVVFVLGILDDRFGVNPKIKFGVQLITAVGVTYLGVVSRILPYYWLNVFITIFWIIGLTNAINLLDNMDGLAGGITIISSLAILLLALYKGETSVAMLSCALAGSCLGFLRYNFSPASIFMGDCGSLFLGYMLAVLAIIGVWQHNSPATGTFLAPILILGVAIFDTTLVTITRLMHGKMPWRGGKDHSSHRLVYLFNGNEKIAVLTLYGLSVLAGILGLLAAKLNFWGAILVAAGFFFALVTFGIGLGKIKGYKSQ